MNYTKTIIKNCTGCGTCINVCNVKAIYLKEIKGYFQAKRNTSLCNECGRCVKVCPKIETVTQCADNPLLIYKGFSRNSEIRYRATSGGIVTTLLHAMVEDCSIDAALLIRKSKEDNFISYEPYWATSPGQVLSSSGSAYQPVPMNILLNQLRNYRRVAVVGLPCHIQGLRSYLRLYPEINSKVIVTIGLTCSHNISKIATGELMREVSVNSLDDLSYRGDGWPSGVKIVKGEDTFFFDNLDSTWHDMFSSFFFCPPYCLTCNDHLAEQADINVSDAWLKEELDVPDNPGMSLIVAWTSSGEKVLTTYAELLELRTIGFDKLLDSQFYPIFFKKHIFSNRSCLISYLSFSLIRTINWFSFSFLYQLLPDKRKRAAIRWSRKIIYRSIRFTNKGKNYFARR